MKSYTWLILIAALIILAGGGVAMAGGDLLGRINRLSDAIAFAEGFYVAGSRPQRDNNPGDLTLSLGFPSSGMDGMYVIFQTMEDGWNALKKQVELMLTNQSHVYNSNMTIFEVAQFYTATDVAAWAGNVAARLGVSPFTKISEV